MTSCKNKTYYTGKGIVVEENRTYFGGVEVRVAIDTIGNGSKTWFWASPIGIGDNVHHYAKGDTVNVEFMKFNSWVEPVPKEEKTK